MTLKSEVKHEELHFMLRRHCEIYLVFLPCLFYAGYSHWEETETVSLQRPEIPTAHPFHQFSPLQLQTPQLLCSL